MTDWIGIFQAVGATLSPIVAFLLLYKQRKFDQAFINAQLKNELRLRLTAAVWQGMQLATIANSIKKKIEGKSTEPFVIYTILKSRLDFTLAELMQIPNWQTDRIAGLARIQDLRSSARFLIEVVDQIIVHPIDLISVHCNDSVLALESIYPISRMDVLLLQVEDFCNICQQAVDEIQLQLNSI